MSVYKIIESGNSVDLTTLCVVGALVTHANYNSFSIADFEPIRYDK